MVALLRRRSNNAIADYSDFVYEDDLDSLTRERFNPRRWTSAEVDELVVGRLDGEEIASLASRFGIHRNTVMKHLVRRGVPSQRRSGRTSSDEDLLAAGQLYKSGLRLELVGEQFGVDRRYLRKMLPGFEFQIRRSGQQKRSSA